MNEDITPRPGGKRPDLRTEIAKARVGDPKWEPCIWRAVGDRDKGGAVIISGGEPRMMTRGPRKGQPSWAHIPKDHLVDVVVTEAELRAAELKYEADTGNCLNCGGSGQEVASAGVGGTQYRQCYRCKGSGEAPKPSP